MTSLNTAPPLSNIDRFNYVTLAILGHLYAHFPVPVRIDPSAMTIDELPDDADEDEVWKLMTAAPETLLWLAREGFLTFESQRHECFERVQLTSKGLSALGKTLASITPGEPAEALGAKAVRLAKQGAKAAGAEALSQVVKAIIEGAVG